MTRRRAPPSRKDDSGWPEVGHGPLDVVLDEVGRGRRQCGPVPPEKHTFNGVCQNQKAGVGVRMQVPMEAT